MGIPSGLQIMQSIAQHALEDYQDFEFSPALLRVAIVPGRITPAASLMPVPTGHFFLRKAAFDFSEQKYQKAAERNLNFVIESQNPNGSWYYSTDNVRDFVDHFHTCFVLKALAKIEQLTGSAQCRSAIERGVGYYVKNLFDANGLPMPFSKPPRLTVYRRELYDYAECINVAVLLQGRFPELDRILTSCPHRSASAVAKIRWLVSGPRAFGWLGQCADASLGPIADVSESLLLPVEKPDKCRKTGFTKIHFVRFSPRSAN